MPSSDVVVIGAGIQGLSAAYRLATRGTLRILVIDSESEIGRGSSSRSASMLMLQRETEPKVQLSLYSYSRYMGFADEFSVPFQFRKIGFLSVATDKKAAAAASLAAMRTSLGVATEILTPDQVTALVPQLNVSDLALGVFGPDDGVLAPLDVMAAYAQAATSLGVEIRLDTRAQGLVLRDGRVEGVKTRHGVLTTKTVVNAAGAGAATVAKWANVALPIDPRKRSIFVADKLDGFSPDTPMVEDAEYEWYFRTEGAGVLMGMGRERSTATSMEPNWAFLPTVLEFARHRAPILGDATVTAGWSGFRPLTPDLNPIIGPVDGVDGLILSCGWGGEGVMHAPAGGDLVANCILGDPEDNPLDVTPFLLSRFRSV